MFAGPKPFCTMKRNRITITMIGRTHDTIERLRKMRIPGSFSLSTSASAMPKQVLDRHRERGEQHRLPQRGPEHGVVHHLSEVLETDEFLLSGLQQRDFQERHLTPRSVG